MKVFECLKWTTTSFEYRLQNQKPRIHALVRRMESDPPPSLENCFRMSFAGLQHLLNGQMLTFASSKASPIRWAGRALRALRAPCFTEDMRRQWPQQQAAVVALHRSSASPRAPGAHFSCGSQNRGLMVKRT